MPSRRSRWLVSHSVIGPESSVGRGKRLGFLQGKAYSPDRERAFARLGAEHLELSVHVTLPEEGPVVIVRVKGELAGTLGVNGHHRLATTAQLDFLKLLRLRRSPNDNHLCLAHHALEPRPRTNFHLGKVMAAGPRQAHPDTETGAETGAERHLDRHLDRRDPAGLASRRQRWQCGIVAGGFDVPSSV